MTAEIINLRKARKAKAKFAAVRTAEENRVRFGRTKAERTQTSAIVKIETSRFEGVKRSNPNEDEDLDPGSVS